MEKAVFIRQISKNTSGVLENKQAQQMPRLSYLVDP